MSSPIETDSVSAPLEVVVCAGPYCGRPLPKYRRKYCSDSCRERTRRTARLAEREEREAACAEALGAYVATYLAGQQRQESDG